MTIIIKLHYGEAELIREQLRWTDDAYFGIWHKEFAKYINGMVVDVWKELELYFVKRTQYKYQGDKPFTFTRAQLNALAVLLMVGMPPAEQTFKNELYTRLLKIIDNKLKQ
ncbi:hypothetical protein [Methylotenera sp.]|uniref:hypothetical protein n=1 Tax=Methylotenera sp. TaxID=2051956 RepID=UPI002ED85EA6